MYRIRKRTLSIVLLVTMILTLMPVPAAAEEDGPAQAAPHILSTIRHEVDGDGAETEQITAQIEAYLTDSSNKTRTVKPCDIIFLIEQSTFMNTQNNTALYGQERADILDTMEKMLDAIPAPTTGGEHRVAITGYGRINNPGNSDTYVPDQYPGKKLDPSENLSLNTGYYTCKDDAPVFHSATGWTEWSRVDGYDEKTTLPQMPAGYLANEAYDDVFMSISDAKDVIDADKMVSWHAQASRMDAGLQLTERLAQIAADSKKPSEDRNLIVFIAASSLPYQNQNGGYQTLRSEAAMEAANNLKKSYGATIFGFGDFNKLNLNNGLTEEEQRNYFNTTMASICGSTDTTDGASYFKGLSQAHDIDEALSELLIQIDANVNPNAERLPINVTSFQEAGSEHTSHTWAQIKAEHHILSSSSINEIASVDYYRFTGYDANNTPQFDTSAPARHADLSISKIGKGDSIQTALNLVPIPPAEKGSAYGEKAVITITDPVCVDYRWVGDWTPSFDPPSHEHAARNTTFSPASPTPQEVSKDNVKLKFDGWYRLWNDGVDKKEDGKKTWNYNGQKYVSYQNTIYAAFGSDLQLYGRWVPFIDVNFHWIGSVTPEGLGKPSSVSLSLDDAGGCFYQAETPTLDGYEFDGWYKDSNCTQRYNSNGEILSANTDLYGSWTKLGTKEVTFTVVNGSWSAESDWYNKHKQTAASADGESSVTVQVPLRNGKGTLTPDLIPYVDRDDMKPSDGYKAPGTWGKLVPDTNADAITENGIYHYTYTFPEADTYTITYRWALGTEVPEDVSLPAQQSAKESGSGKKPTFSIEQPKESSDKKWHFDGWYTKSENAETYQQFLIDKDEYSFDNTTKKNLTLYGKWSHEPCKVTFYADYDQLALGHFSDGSYSVSYTVPYGSELAEAVPTPAPNSAATYYFEGWMDGSDIFYTSRAIQTMTVKGDLSFVAQWWPIVTFDANGGVWELSEGQPKIRYVPVPANTNNHIDALSPPVKEGYTFLGWCYKDAGEIIDFKTETFKGAKTVYARWAKNATVTFKIVNGYWSGATAEDRNVTVVLYPQADGSVGGTLPASSVPAIMIPAAGYENAAGSWDAAPNIEPNGIVDSVTYTYTFGQTHSGGSTSTKLTLHYESNGGTSYRDERYSSGTIVNLDKIPIRGGYTFSGWYADAGLTAPITNVRMTENKTVYAGWEATAVPDMLDGTGHYIYAVGYTDGTIRPNANISRAEVAAIFFRLLKSDIRDKNVTTSNTFEDVQSGQWFNMAVSTMEKLGVVKGRSAEFFDPDAPITRAEFSVICASFDRRQINGSTSFSDLSGHWAEKSIERAAALGWIAGYADDTFRPNHYITRAEAMTMINRVLCRVPETEGDLLPGMITWPDNQPGTWYYLAVQEATNSHDYDRKDTIHEKWTALTKEPDWKYDLAQ